MQPAGAWTEGQLGAESKRKRLEKGAVWGLWATCGVFCVLRVVKRALKVSFSCVCLLACFLRRCEEGGKEEARHLRAGIT